MATLIDGKAIAEKLNQKTVLEVARLKKRGITPKLGVVLVGDHKPSHLYVKNKERAAMSLGIDFLLEKVPANITLPKLINLVAKIQSDPKLTGIIVQLPLPDHLDTYTVLQAIRPELDADCLTEVNLGKLFRGNPLVIPPTPGAIISIFEELKVSLVGKNVTIVGTGPLVGRPLALILMSEHATVTTCNRKTRGLKEKCRSADILISVSRMLLVEEIENPTHCLLSLSL